MLTKLDPTAEAWADPTHELDPDLLSTYTQYKAVTAYLPGNYSIPRCYAIEEILRNMRKRSKPRDA